jgi:hypothetical protein
MNKDDPEHDRISKIIDHLKNVGKSSRNELSKTMSYYKNKNIRKINTPHKLQSDL